MKNNDRVFIELDRPRELWFGHKAEKRLLAEFGIEALTIDMGNITPEHREQIMLCMLERDAAQHGENLTLERVSDLLDCVRPKTVLMAINNALVAAYALSDAELAETGDADPTTVPA